MTQNRARPARQNSSNEATGDRELPVPERVHAPPERLQPASRDAPLYGPRPNAVRHKLLMRDHPMLPRGHPSNERIHVGWCDLSLTMRPKVRHPGNIAASGSAGCAVCNGCAKRALLAAGAVRAAAALQAAHLGAWLPARLLRHQLLQL